MRNLPYGVEGIENLTDRGEVIGYVVADALPHGSGIDGPWLVRETKAGTFWCSNGYHAMDEIGAYCCWNAFTAIVAVEPNGKLVLKRVMLRHPNYHSHNVDLRNHLWYEIHYSIDDGYVPAEMLAFPPRAARPAKSAEPTITRAPAGVITALSNFGPYTGLDRKEQVKFLNGRTFTLILYRAFNACGLIGTEYNGIGVMDDDERKVLVDNHAVVSSGFYGATPKQWLEFDRIKTLDWEGFRAFVNGHKRSRYSI